MQRIFSTEGIQEGGAFRRWREICEDRLVPMKQDALGNHPFEATIDGCNMGGLTFTKFILSDLRATTDSHSIRHRNNKPDFLYLSMVLDGVVASNQNDLSIIDRVGDITIRDPSRPWTIEHRGRTNVLAIEIPRSRLENILGSARHFVGLTMYAANPVTQLTKSFLENLVRRADQLTPRAAERLTSVGIDLVAASLAERIAMEPPGSLRSVRTLQSAKAYIATSLSDRDLSPPQVSAAVGISLRSLQSLFKEEGYTVSLWIWQQRLEKAAQLLADRSCRHMSLGEISFRCGFEDQAHFSRRFRLHFGVPPSEYRQIALEKFTV